MTAEEHREATEKAKVNLRNRMIRMLSNEGLLDDPLFEDEGFRRLSFISHLLPTLSQSENPKDLHTAYHCWRMMDAFSSVGLNQTLDKAGPPGAENERSASVYRCRGS